ncbi:CHAT domain-containing protein [Streptomyces sp. NPDC101166]|uniref:CHAT domain-containing protein n=1 Tax=Streptomyces sp. NPDC101166 TaxID=3366120 RepID=UPI0038195517
MTAPVHPWEPRCALEAELRAFRASDRFWSDEDLEDEARQALESLLTDPNLPAESLRDALDDIWVEHLGAARLWNTFHRQYEQEHRSATPAEPTFDPVNTGPRTAPGDFVDFDVVGDVALPSEEADEDTAADRFLNLWLTWPLSQIQVPTDRCLAVGRRYELVMSIGKLIAESLLSESAQPFPDDLLDPADGHWLTVSVCSDDFAVSPAHHHLFLPKEGGSWVCECSPDGPGHVCEPDHRGRYLRVPVVAPPESGPARLRLLVAHRGHQLQSATLTAMVAPRETRVEGTPPVSAEIDYTLTPGFVGLAALPPRTAAIRISQAADGSFAVDVDGASGAVSTFRLGELQTAGALEQARTALMAVHAGVKDGERVNLLTSDNRKSREAFLTDLENLAGIGWDLFVLLAPRSAQRQALRGVLGGAAQLQICRQEGMDLAFPWALVYDIPVVRGATWKPCRQGLEPDLPADTRECPGADGHQLNTLCPYGFWGYRHVIEQPPSRRSEGQHLALVAGRGEGAPAMTVARSTALDAGETERHVARLHSRFGGRLTDHTAKAALIDALVEAPDCVYFYCHGRTPENGREAPGHTVLEIGEKDRIPSQDLAAITDARWASWHDRSPLVFLNGCHTVDSGPATWLSYADAFTDLHASGVVGTEISVAQTLASEVAELFWQALLEGRSVGSALHSARTALLGKGNLLGLAYTAYCSSSLTLRPTAASG